MRSNFFGTVGWEISGSALTYQINRDDPLVRANREANGERARSPAGWVCG